MSGKFELAAAAIVKNEGRYIREWIDSHLGVGFQHFLIFDNQSSDDTVSKLEYFIKRHLVTLVDWPCYPGQLLAYAAALQTLRDYAKWVAFIDADEFLYSVVEQDLKKVIRNYEQFPGIGVHWLIYGSNGRKKYEDLPVVERFTRRCRQADKHIKSIVQPCRTIPTGNDLHSFHYLDGLAVNEKFQQLPPDQGYLTDIEPAADILRINHYVTKSEEECFERCQQGRADNGNKKEWPGFFIGHDLNDIEDDSALNRYRQAGF